MAKFHLNENGDPGPCKAEQGNCPFGGEANHYPTKEAARKAFELSMASEGNKPKKKRLSSAEAIAQATERRKLNDFTHVYNTVVWGHEDSEFNEELKPTLDKLTELSSRIEEGDMFERASKLKELFIEERTQDVMDPDELPRDAYLQVIAPATNNSVLEIERTLENHMWTIRQWDRDIDVNRYLFSQLMKRDMSKPEAGREAVEYLSSNGWDLDTGDKEAEGQLRDAILAGQRKAVTYGNDFALEQKRLL